MGRRARGSVYEKPAGSGRWYYALTLRSGRRWVKPVPPHPSGKALTERQAEAYKDELLRMYAAGEWDPEKPAAPAAPAMPTVADYAVAWSTGLKHSSAGNERQIVDDHLVGTAVGAMPLDRARPPDFAAWVGELRDKAVQRGSGTLAASTVRTIHGAVKRCLAQAVFEGLIPFNPAVLPKGKLPKLRDKVQGARRTWNFERDEVVTLISDRRLSQVKRMIYGLLFLGGPRGSEMICLRWRDYLATMEPLGCMVAERAMKYTKASRGAKRTRFEGETKTGATKLIPVHPTLAAMLAEWRLSGWAKYYGRPPTDDDLIVPTRKLTIRMRETVYSELQKDCDRVGLRRRRMHGARHTFITLAVEDGAEEKFVRQITHPVPEGAEADSFQKYLRKNWPVLCREMLKLRLYRRGDELPLWKAASGGGGGGEQGGAGSAAGGSGQSDSATGIATGRARASSDTGKPGQPSTTFAPEPGAVVGGVVEAPRGAQQVQLHVEGGRVPAEGDAQVAAGARALRALDAAHDHAPPGVVAAHHLDDVGPAEHRDRRDEGARAVGVDAGDAVGHAAVAAEHVPLALARPRRHALDAQRRRARRHGAHLQRADVAERPGAGRAARRVGELLPHRVRRVRDLPGRCAGHPRVGRRRVDRGDVDPRVPRGRDVEAHAGLDPRGSIDGDRPRVARPRVGDEARLGAGARDEQGGGRGEASQGLHVNAAASRGSARPPRRSPSGGCGRRRAGPSG